MPGSDEHIAVLAPPPIVDVDNVFMRFGTLEAVSGVSFSVQPGGIFGFVGSDGAGKTTLLRMIAGMLRPSSGHVRVNGLEVASERNQVKKLIGYMPQRFGLYPDLTVAENMAFFMDVFGISGAERQARRERYLGFSNLTPFEDRLARDLSGGMKQKLGLACVLVHQPRVLILDEPTNGVDPVSRKEFWEILHAMRQQGMTILVSTAYLDEGEKCDQVILMHNAHVLEQASPQSLRAGCASLEDAMIQRIQAADQILAGDHFDI